MAEPTPIGTVIANLPAHWRERAELFRAHGATESAVTLEYVATELEDAMRALGERLVTLTEASREGGYSTRHLARMIAQGTLVNRGHAHRPLLRLAEVPRRPGHLPPREPDHHIGRAPGQVARSVVAQLSEANQ